jgi:long-chain acyl-CoA synthetase
MARCRRWRAFGKRMTYAQMGEAARAVTSWLQTQGFVKGDRIALMMPNVMAYPPLIFGALAGGYVVVNVNPLYTPRELTHQLKDSGARALFVLENFGKTVEETVKAVKLDRIVLVTPGDLLGLKGKIINFVSRRVKKAVPAFSLPGAISFAAVLSQGSVARARLGRGHARRSRFPAIYRRHHRRLQGRDAASPQCRRQCRAGRASDR